MSSLQNGRTTSNNQHQNNNGYNNKQIDKLQQSNVHKFDSDSLIVQNETIKVEEKGQQGYNVFSSDFGQETSILSNHKFDLRKGESFRSQWINEKVGKKSPIQSMESFSESDNHSIQAQSQQQNKDNIFRQLKSHELPFEISHARRESYKESQCLSNENISIDNNKSQSKNNEAYDSTVRSRPIHQRSGRLSHRYKQDDFIFDSTKKKRNIKTIQDVGTKLDSQDSVNLESGKQLEQSKKKINRTPHEVWVQGFFNILIFFNRFVYRNRLKLIHFRPNELLDNQLHAINDLAAYNYHEGENKQQIRDNIFRSQYKIVRKLRIFYLITRKKFKLFILPIKIFNKKVTNILKKVLDPIPVILPYYKISLFWDFISVFFILVNVFKIPFEIAFAEGHRVYEDITGLSKIFFLLNFFMMLNTAYYENGVLQKNRSKIFFYFLKHRIIIEILAYLCLWLSPFGTPTLRLFFLIKFFSFYEIIEKLAESLQLSDKYSFIVNLITLLVEIVLLCHLFACAWFALGEYEYQNNVVPNWIQFYNIANKSIKSQYVSALYFSVVTIGTIGFGDIVAKSELEKECISAMSVLSCGIFAYIQSNIQNVYREYNQKQEVYLVNLSELNHYMFSREVNPNLQQMARKYLKYVHEQNFKKGVMPSETLNVLSKFLREEIIEEIFKRSINNIPFLKSFSSQFQQALSIKMKEINYGKSKLLNTNLYFQIHNYPYSFYNFNNLIKVMDQQIDNFIYIQFIHQQQNQIFYYIGPDEMIMKSGSYQQPSLYYILKGSVEISLDQGTQKSVQFNSFYEKNPFYLHSINEVFGQYEFISQSHQSVTNAKSLEVTTIHQLLLSDFIEVINQFSTDKEKYLEMKDKINLYQDYASAKVFCYSCKSSQHLIKDCPIFFYKPGKQRIANQFNRQQEVMKKEIKRNNDRLILNALSFQYEIEDDCIFFREENQSELGSLIQIQEMEEEEVKSKNTKTKKNTNDIQSINVNNVPSAEKNVISRLSASMSRMSQSQTQSFYTPERIIEEKDEESRQDRSKLNTHSQISVSANEKQNILKSKNSLSTFTSSSSSSSILEEQLKNKHDKENKEETNLLKQALQQLMENQINIKVVDRKSINRINSKQEFQRKATLLGARTKKNWNIEEKKITGDPSHEGQNLKPRPSQIAIPSDVKSMNNPLYKNMKRAITIGQMQHVLEYMNMINAQKALKQQFEPIDDVITETVRNFKIYMIHNNIGAVLKQYNEMLKLKAKKRRQKMYGESLTGTKMLLSRHETKKQSNTLYLTKIKN